MDVCKEDLLLNIFKCIESFFRYLEFDILQGKLEPSPLDAINIDISPSFFCQSATFKNQLMSPFVVLVTLKGMILSIRHYEN